jgi:hypothetical protein
MRHYAHQNIEIAIRPHHARKNWGVLRVTFAHEPDHETRVARALDALLGGSPESTRPPSAQPSMPKAQCEDAGPMITEARP